MCNMSHHCHVLTEIQFAITVYPDEMALQHFHSSLSNFAGIILSSTFLALKVIQYGRRQI